MLASLPIGNLVKTRRFGSRSLRSSVALWKPQGDVELMLVFIMNRLTELLVVITFGSSVAYVVPARAQTLKKEPDATALVQVRIATQELAMPPQVELEQVKGFSLYALKAVLNGRGDELVELAKTNLR